MCWGAPGSLWHFFIQSLDVRTPAIAWEALTPASSSLGKLCPVAWHCGTASLTPTAEVAGQEAAEGGLAYALPPAVHGLSQATWGPRGSLGSGLPRPPV